MVAISRKSHLSSRRTIRLTELGAEPMIAVARHIHPGFYQYIYKSCLQHGFEPNIVQEVTTLAECLRMVAEGGGYTFMPSSYEEFQCAGVVFRSIEKHLLWLDFGIAYKAEVQSPIIERLISSLENKRKPQRAGLRPALQSA